MMETEGHSQTMRMEQVVILPVLMFLDHFYLPYAGGACRDKVCLP